jgi:ubiquinone/menaquinone biosynthesis C-methylase UbiE
VAPKSVVDQPDASAAGESGAEVAERKRQSYELWERMAKVWERRRGLAWRWTRPVGEWLVDRLDPQPGQTILDLAAGTGETGFLAARRLGSDGRLISSDFSPQMVAAAERVAKELSVESAEFRILDAEQLDLGDGSVDGVLCRFSYMLMADPLEALRETRRVLRAGGRLAFSTWGEAARNSWMTFSVGVLIERGLMEPFSSDGPGVFSMPDEQAIVPLVREAGFDQIEVEEMELRWRFESSDELWILASEMQGPVASAIATLEEEQQRAVRAAIEERAAAFAIGDRYEIPGLSINVIAY